MNDELKEIIEYYETHMEPGSSEDLLSMLREIQESAGCISVEIQAVLSDRFSIKPSYLSAVMKRYPSLKQQPSKYDIKVCMDSRCQSNSSGETMKALEHHLNIKKGQSTKDGMFSLNTCLCLHQCQKGPNVLVNGELFSGVDSARVPHLLDQFFRSKR